MRGVQHNFVPGTPRRRWQDCGRGHAAIGYSPRSSTNYWVARSAIVAAVDHSWSSGSTPKTQAWKRCQSFCAGCLVTIPSTDSQISLPFSSS